MSKRKLENITCPMCGESMSAGNRARITIGWEFFRSEKPEACYMKDRVVSFLEHKTVSKMVCRACAEKLADETSLKKPIDLK